MKYSKSVGLSGAWVKASEVADGEKCKLVSETRPVSGKYGEQDVAKIRFQGEQGEARNVKINKATINALIDAFGEDSTNWQGHILTAQTDKMVVSGRRITVLYLIPEGYELTEDSGGYIVIDKIGKDKEVKVEEVEDIPPEDVPFD